ncbi:MAG: type II toxin-antitoxin system VapC family toxin [Proteobacteria bacterium]|nr:type II toxin-antitoxin system VapC family toxin [Pseudomonadota bacterium]
MIGLDTNVIIRYIVQDEPKQARKASKVIEGLTKEEPGYISFPVLCELVWVLERAYGYEKSVIVQVIQQLLSTAELQVQQPEIVWAALRVFSTSRAGFADYMIVHINQAAGCSQTLTFDRKAADHPLFRVL